MAITDGDKLIGKRLQAMRDECDVTQDRLATYMRSKGYKWSKATVSGIENGERPLKLQEAADLMGCFERSTRSIVDLVGPVHEVTIAERIDDLKRAYGALHGSAISRYAQVYYRLIREVSRRSVDGVLTDEERDDARSALERYAPDGFDERARRSMVNSAQSDKSLTPIAEPWDGYMYHVDGDGKVSRGFGPSDSSH